MDLEDIISLLGYIYIGVALLLWVGVLLFMFRVVALRKDGVNKWRDTGGNPFNLIFMSSKLTQKGLLARRKLSSCILGFILMVIMPFLFRAMMTMFT